ncbi:ADP-ribosyltransferase [Nocardia vinacea]|uniref:ADP-ribosyltransferase n=1 Tax=Nocardia vinacea TaxID=96468 RepID=UPI002E1417B6|nr:ADP-ribosyltransferase [Nocardia vinacea]
MTDADSRFAVVPLAEVVLAGQGVDRLSSTERDVIEAYALGGYERINQAMRGQIPMTVELERRIETIRCGLQKYPLPEAVRVTRETDAAVYGLVDEESARALIDVEFREDGFLSTSGVEIPPHSTRHADPVILDLVVPAGTPVLRLGELAEIAEEREVLIIDARSYFVVDVAFDSVRSMWRIYAVVMEGEL